jgi:hypothetical protein
MKYILILSILTAALGGCAIAPADYGDRERGSNRDDGNYRYRDYNDGKFLNYGHCGEQGQRMSVPTVAAHSRFAGLRGLQAADKHVDQICAI